MRILSAARLGEVNTNELRNKSNATTFTPLVSLIFFLHRSPFSDRTREPLKSDQVTLSNCNKFLRLDRNSASFSRGNTACKQSIPAVPPLHMSARVHFDGGSNKRSQLKEPELV